MAKASHGLTDRCARSGHQTLPFVVVGKSHASVRLRIASGTLYSSKPRCFAGRRLEDAWKTWRPLAKFFGRRRSGKRILIIYYILYWIRVFQGILREACMSSRRLPGGFQENMVALIMCRISCAKPLHTSQQCAATCQAGHISERLRWHAGCGGLHTLSEAM